MAIQVSKLGVEKYTIQINDGGEIVFNPGVTGLVTINGNLDVIGETTTIGSSELIIDDNTITINNGENGPGVSLITAGIIIDRGDGANDAFLFFDESKNSIRGGAGIPGAFVLQDSTASGSNLALFSLYASGILTDGEDLVLIGSGSGGKVTVTGTNNYESTIWDYAGAGDVIPEDSGETDRLSRANIGFDDDTLLNVRGLIDYVSSYHLYNFQDRIVARLDDATPTFVIAEDDDNTSKVSVVVANNTITEFFENRVEMQNLRIVGASGGGNSTITSNSTNGNIILQGTGTGQVQINDFMNLTIQNDALLPAPASGVVLFSKTLADGGTGLYFKNQDSTTDEIISRNKALLFSIIF